MNWDGLFSGLLDNTDFAICTLDGQSLVTWDEIFEDEDESTVKVWDISIAGKGLVTKNNLRWFVEYARSQGVYRLEGCPTKPDNDGRFNAYCEASKSRGRLYKRLGFVDDGHGDVYYVIGD